MPPEASPSDRLLHLVLLHIISQNQVSVNCLSLCIYIYCNDTKALSINTYGPLSHARPLPPLLHEEERKV